MVESLHSPKDIQNLSYKELHILSAEIRDIIIRTVAKNGGHLASNLGFVEPTLSLHRTFDFSKDSLLFDVGHQCYTHKILTGRYENFSTLRQKDGISGFPNKNESPYDAATAGHSGSSVSTAVGIATANALMGSDAYTVAVVGDGSFTNGMIYEALNNCKKEGLRLIIILNDNDMSISRNVGNLSSYLSRIRTSTKYYRFKNQFQRVFRRIPYFGNAVISLFRHIKHGLKRAFYKQPFFEPMGIKYFGPVAGDDMERLENTIREAKKRGGCALIHIKTVKGKGYLDAENRPECYHSVSPFDIVSGIPSAAATDFSASFGRSIVELAKDNTRVVAVTAAMRDGTGLTEFSKRFPDRFFDVGIAEEHEITFGAGLAAKGLIPVCAVYATFAQRVFDQVIHDVSLQRLPMVIAVDRGGLVPHDGETHQGIFDIPMFSAIPRVTIDCPATYDELHASLKNAVGADNISVIRYPKGAECVIPDGFFTDVGDFSLSCDGDDSDVLIVVYGRLTENAVKAAEILRKSGKRVHIMKLLRVHPLSADTQNTLIRLCRHTKKLLILDESSYDGGIAQHIKALLCDSGISGIPVTVKAIFDAFPRHATVKELQAEYGFDVDSIICACK